MLNFTWWVNRKDTEDVTSSKGGSWAWTTSASSNAAPRCPTAGTSTSPTHQLDGDVQPHLMRIALELAQYNHAIEDIATKFFGALPAHR